MEEMIKERHGRFIRFLSDILLLFACCLFLISVVEPFVIEWTTVFWLDGSHPSYTTPIYYYWSFQVYHVFPSGNNRLYTFKSYWSNHDYELSTQFTQAPRLLIAMFLMQIVAIASGLLSLGFRKAWIRLIPFISSAYVISLMILTHNELAGRYSHIMKYEIGYWLTYPSMLLFLLAFTMRFIAGKGKTGSGSLSGDRLIR